VKKLVIVITCCLILCSNNVLAESWSLGDLQNGWWNEIIFPGNETTPGNQFRAGSLEVPNPYTWTYMSQWEINGLILQNSGSASLAGYNDRSVYDYGTLTLHEDLTLWGSEVEVDVNAVRYSIRYGEPLNFVTGSGSDMDYYMEIFGKKDGLDYLMTFTFEGSFGMPSLYYPDTRSYDLGPAGDHWGAGFKNITLNITPSSIPEPATMLLLGLGMVGLAGVKKKFKN